MTRVAFAAVVLWLGTAGSAGLAQHGPTAASPPAPVATHAATTGKVESQRAVIAEYCLTCHNDVDLKGNMSLAGFDVAHPERRAELAEKMIRKLRAGMMPPPGRERPAPETVRALAAAIEARIDRAAAVRPNPGWRPFQRLNRAEYARAVRNLLDIEVDAAAFLPPDTISHGFDNIADAQAFSPTLMEGYLRAASRISHDAIGNPRAVATQATYKVPRTASQASHVEGAPFGTRGGLAVVHNFPADGEYTFRILLHGTPTGQLFGATRKGEQLEIAVNGERLALLDIDPGMSESDPDGLTLQTGRLFVKGGPQRLSAAFIERFTGPVDDLMAPIDHTLADTQIGSAFGITTLPHLRDLAISGPHKITGMSETSSRRRIFRCRPTDASEETPCARQIVSQLASQAYRRRVTAGDIEPLMGFYETGRREGDFESGVRTALQAILASPHFVFRLEPAPTHARAGRNYRIGDEALASRLSFFLWAAGPDEELLTVASQGLLHEPAVLRKQAQRLLRDPRSEALATRFAAQWLRLQDLDTIHPDPRLYPSYDHTLARSMRRETELFFDSLVREDRSALELLTADYTFVNERLARHYGIPNVSGSGFRRVNLADEHRRGLLGQGSILTLTSVADRTSPVLRGKWVMEVLLGSPPPPPPPNVPDFESTDGVREGRLLSVRERLEEHRKNPSCRSCHRVIDPIGLALEPFDVTGAFRIKDHGVVVDAAGELFDGAPVNGPVSLRQALLTYSESVMRSFTESLMTYALGRRVEYYDMPTVRAIAREAAGNGHRMSSFILGIVKSPAFQMSRSEDVVSTQ